jgi:hypothetical protein
MTNETRSNLRWVHGEDPENLPFLYFLMTHSKGAELVKTIKGKGLRGTLFTEFIRERCKGEPLRLLNWVLNETLKVNKAKTPKVLGNGLIY